ncbi:MAG: hypothetical protein GF401_03195 [Chitinivibrionales bacterium]|nr:hypothetical protein [Chitinivibrionales bacterium]
MLRYLPLFLAAGLVSSLFAEDAKPEFKPYGFIKGDMYMAMDGVESWGQAQPTAVSRATGNENYEPTMAFTASHSRFGLKGQGSVKEIPIGGVLELDFFSAKSNTNFNANPRLRQAYAWVKPGMGFEVRIGQQWDLFSPLNPTTNNTNANLWYNGNYGFRRPQFQVRYGMELESIKPGIQFSIGEGAKEASGIGLDNLSLMPLIQGRLSAEIMEKATVGISGVYTTLGENDEITTYGVSGDVGYTLNKLLALKGEVAWGQNLNDVNIFTTAGNKFVYNKDGTPTDSEDKEILGFWFNALSKPLDYLHVAAGFAMEMNNTEIPNEEAVDENMTAYGDLIFPLGKHFSLAAEYQFVKTTHFDGNEYTANVIDLAGKISF